MAITFAVRGDSLTARYSGGYSGAAVLDSGRVGGIPTVTADGTAIGGFSIDMEGNVRGGLSYSSRDNFTKTGDFSVLVRLSSDAVSSTQQIWRWGRPSASFSQPLFETNFKQGSGGFQTYQYNDRALLGIGGTYIADDSMANSTWYDLVFTFNNTTGKYEIFQDAVSLGSSTSTRLYFKPGEMDLFGEIVFGHGNFVDGAYYSLNEMVLWDEVIDPTSVTLTSGSDSLDGASRTAFVEVDASTGPPSSGGGGGNSAGLGIAGIR
jgi:hypothetical protein